MADFTLLLEAEKRGILPADKVPLLAEARKRGLVPGLTVSDPGPTSFASFEGYSGAGHETLGQVPIEEAAPAVLGSGGAALGTALGQPFYGGVAGAGVGNMVKQGMKAIRGEPIDIEQATKEGLADMALGGLGSTGGVRMLPVVNPAEREAIEIAMSAGVPISADLLHPSWFTKAVAYLGNAFLPGRVLGTKYRKEMFSVSENMANDLLAGTASEPSVGMAMQGLSLREGMRAAKKEFWQIGKKGYEAQAQLGKDYGGELVGVQQFRQAIGELKNNASIAGDKAINKYLDDILAKTEGGFVNFHDLTNMYNKINRNVKGLQNPGASEQLFDALHADMSAWGRTKGVDVAQVFVDAKAKWKDKITFDKVHRLFQNSSKTDDFGNVYFNPDKFLDTLENPTIGIGTQLEKTFGKDGAAERLKGLRNFAELMRYARQEAHRDIKTAGGSWYNYIGPGDAAMGLTGATGMSKALPWLPIPYTLSMAATLQTLKPNSTMKQLMKMSLGPIPPRLAAGAGAGTGVSLGELMFSYPTQVGAVPLR
jgi:hypothetical protein